MMALTPRMSALLTWLDGGRGERNLGPGIGAATVEAAIASGFIRIRFSRLHGRQYLITRAGSAALHEHQMASARMPRPVSPG
ncbi:MAG TPA: hypothetical protein VNX29_07160 [Kaistia sp.]|nr:hypothetical protein [Kaistia sp.]